MRLCCDCAGVNCAQKKAQRPLDGDLESSDLRRSSRHRLLGVAQKTNHSALRSWLLPFFVSNGGSIKVPKEDWTVLNYLKAKAKGLFAGYTTRLIRPEGYPLDSQWGFCNRGCAWKFLQTYMKSAVSGITEWGAPSSKSEQVEVTRVRLLNGSFCF